MLDHFAGSTSGIGEGLVLVNNDDMFLGYFLHTRLTMIPPSEWQMNMIGRCVASSSYFDVF